MVLVQLRIKSLEQNNINISCFNTCQGSLVIKYFAGIIQSFDKNAFPTENVVLAHFGFPRLVLASSNSVDFS